MARKKAEVWHLVPCDGAAHSNAYIDNCMVCAPRWGFVCVPASCADLDAWRDMLTASRGEAGSNYWTGDRPAYKALRRRQKLADARMRKAENEAERNAWARRGPAHRSPSESE